MSDGWKCADCGAPAPYGDNTTKFFTDWLANHKCVPKMHGRTVREVLHVHRHKQKKEA